MSDIIHLAGRDYLLPILPPTPLEKNYEVNLSEALREPTPTELSGVAITKIEDSQITSSQKQLLIAIAVVAGLILVAGALLTAGLSAGIIPLIVIGAVFTFTMVAGGCPLLIEYSCLKDRVERLQQKLEKFAAKSFIQLTEKEVNNEDLIAHDLLRLKIPSISPDQKKRYYWKMTQLIEHHAKLIEVETTSLNQIQEIYNTNISKLAHLQDVHENFPAYHQRHPELGDDSLQKYEQLKDTYLRFQGQWDDWKNHEMNAAREAFATAHQTLSDAYDQLTIETQPAIG